jgi:hypothetical protein
MLGSLSEKYESGGRGPGTIGRNEGDAGGASYGTYQLSSTAGSVQEFINWMLDRPRFALLAQALQQAEIASEAFDKMWTDVANVYPDRFAEAQHDYIESAYYWPAVQSLQAIGYNPQSEAIQQVIWSAAVQYGPGWVDDLFREAADFAGVPLAEADDRTLIENIYIVRGTDDWTSGSPSLRPALRDRFKEECLEALAMV